MKNIDKINLEFNKALLKYKNGSLSSRYMFKLGKTNEKWHKKGIVLAEIRMKQSVIKKATETKHDLLFEHFVNLPYILQEPIDFYISKTVKDSIVVVTKIKDVKNKQVIMALHIYLQQNLIEIGEIKSMYGKESRVLKQWENEGLKL